MVKLTVKTSVIILASILYLTTASCLSFSVNAQQQPISNNLPVLLIHGYNENPNIWDSWKNWLQADGFSNVYAISFHDDKCGSVVDHAAELTGIVNKILHNTGSQKVNIVAHSKGGLDARWYMAHGGGADKVANLIMIGTPNSGSPAAVWDITGCPLGSDKDLLPGSAATQVADRSQSAHYYTIAGNWRPNQLCPTSMFGGWVPDGGNCLIPGKDDLFVSVDSAAASPHSHYIPLGPPFPYDHFALLTHRDVFDKTLPKLSGQ
jgi:pimeloyl-ACP methyl ester carboxylesterase